MMIRLMHETISNDDACMMIHECDINNSDDLIYYHTDDDITKRWKCSNCGNNLNTEEVENR